MSPAKRAVFLAFDLGAESGRALAGILEKERLSLEEIHRFPNGPVQIHGSLYWDVLRLFSEMRKALRMAATQYGSDVVSIGIDTWGVDFALLDHNGELVGNPHHYRDPRTQGMMDETFRRVPKEEIYEHTGIQFMPINTLYQLLAMVVRNSPQLEVAETFLMIPDLFNYWLSGVKVCEFTDATTQFYDPRKGNWARALLEKLRILGKKLEAIHIIGGGDEEHPPLPAHRRCHRTPGYRRPCGSHGHRQHPDAGPGQRSHRLSGRGQGAHPAFFRVGHV